TWSGTPSTPTASAAMVDGPRRTRSRPANSTAISTSCSSATRRSARRATCPKTRRGGGRTRKGPPPRTPRPACLFSRGATAGVSGGDQVEVAGVETQWTAFLAPDELRTYPWVATIGNHDVGSKAYEQHLWTPNTDRALSHYTTGANRSGGDYWFIYKNVLFID